MKYNILNFQTHPATIVRVPPSIPTHIVAKFSPPLIPNGRQHTNKNEKDALRQVENYWKNSPAEGSCVPLSRRLRLFFL